MSYIGQPVNKSDAKEKVTGKALFPGDFNMPNQAYMKILFANRPHAKIIKIDTSNARSMEGVIAIFTASDVPKNKYGLIMPDQPVLCGPGSDMPYADHVRFIGDQVAIIVADTEEIASKASEKIIVEYKDLPIVDNVHDAIRPDSPLLHPDLESNIFLQYRIRKGDIENAFTNADVIIEGEYRTPSQEHIYLQPEAGIAYIDEEDRVALIVAGQWAHEDQEQIAHALNLPLNKVRVIYPAIGGAFGGREDMSIQIVLALAAWRLNQMGIKRPVKIIWSREESIIGHHKRHPYYIRTRWGATKKGRIIAAEIELIADGGAYAYTSTKVLGNATITCTGPYEIPNVKVDASVVYTNNIPSGAFRGFGGPQGAFIAESQMNKLAEALKIDPVELRIRNVLSEGSLLGVDSPIPKGVSIAQVVEECARKAGWQKGDQGWKFGKTFPVTVSERPQKRRGIGFACGFKNVGFSFGAPEECWAIIELHGGVDIERAILHHAGADVGQGSHTIFAQMVSDALNISIDKVELDLSDTATSRNSGSASASRLTFMAGNSIYGAAGIALKKWKDEERPAIGKYQYLPPRTTPLEPQTGECYPNFAYGYVAEVVEVEVDTEIGEVRIVNVICADDVGHAINPLLVKGQIEGCIAQATGYTLLENFIQKKGEVLTRELSTYLIPTVLDVPDSVESIILEYPDPIGPWGARGMGEMPFLPFAPAVTAAVHAATGVWFDEFPLTPERVLKGLGKLD